LGCSFISSRRIYSVKDFYVPYAIFLYELGYRGGERKALHLEHLLNCPLLSTEFNPTGYKPVGRIFNPTGYKPVGRIFNPTGYKPVGRIFNPTGYKPIGRILSYASPGATIWLYVDALYFTLWVMLARQPSC
jgi:hypothetical protein